MNKTQATLKATGFYGRDFTRTFDRPTVLTGPVGAGKTMTLRAIRVAVLGYDPEVGRQTGKAAGLFGPDGGRVEFTLGNETFSTEVKVSRGKAKIAHNASRVVEELALNPDVFLAAGPTERARIIRDIYPSDGLIEKVCDIAKKAGVTPPKAGMDIASWQRDELRPAKRATEMEADKLRAELSVLVDMASSSEELPNLDKLNNAANAASDTYHTLKANLEARDFLRAELAALPVNIPEDSRPVPPSEDDIRELSKAIGAKLSEQNRILADLHKLDVLEGKSECPTCRQPIQAGDVSEQIDALKKKAAELKDEIDSLNAQQSQMMSVAASVEELHHADEKRADIRARLGAVPPVTEAEVREAATAVVTAQAALKAATETVQAIAKAEAAARRRAQIEQQIGAATLKIQAIADADTATSKLLKSYAADTVDKVVALASRAFSEIVGRDLECKNLVFQFEDESGATVTEKSFSGGQKAALWLSVALALSDGFPVVLMDELGRLDTVTKSALIGLVEERFDGVFVGTDSSDLTPKMLPEGSDVEIVTV